MSSTYTNNPKTATYEAPENGLATLSTLTTAIMNDDDYVGSSGVYFKIVIFTKSIVEVTGESVS